jgi:hypothetical protein
VLLIGLKKVFASHFTAHLFVHPAPRIGAAQSARSAAVLTAQSHERK